MNFSLTKLPIKVSKYTIAQKYQFNGEEIFYLGKLSDYLIKPNIERKIKVKKKEFTFFMNVISRIDTENEIKYFENDGILPFVLNKI